MEKSYFLYVCDNHVAAGGERGEAVLKGRLEMVERVLAPPHVERVRVREERHPADAADGVNERLRPVGTEIREAAGLAEVRLDGDVLAVEADLRDAGRLQEARELLLEVLRVRAAEVCEVYDGFLLVHSVCLPWKRVSALD